MPIASYLAPPDTLSPAMLIIIRDHHEMIPTDGSWVHHVLAEAKDGRL